MNGLCSGRMADIDTLYIQLSKAWILPFVMGNDALFVVESYRGFALQEGGICITTRVVTLCSGFSCTGIYISIHTTARVVTLLRG